MDECSSTMCREQYCSQLTVLSSSEQNKKWKFVCSELRVRFTGILYFRLHGNQLASHADVIEIVGDDVEVVVDAAQSVYSSDIQVQISGKIFKL